jgi:hypothetical protein
MTALDQYIRLEAIGLWQETPETPEREVIVSFGNASLVLSDTSDRPLAHWSLVGTRPLRVDPDGATVYSTTLDGYETLAIRDAEMVRAIAAVSAAGRFAPKPEPRRHGRWIAAGVVVLALAGLAWFGPPSIRWQAARMLPPEWVERFGDEMLLQVMGAQGAPCSAQAGQLALRKLAEALALPERPRVRVLELPGAPVAVLPAGYMLLDARLIALAESPEEIAGWIALGQARGELHPATEAMMADAGPPSPRSRRAGAPRGCRAVVLDIRAGEDRVAGHRPDDPDAVGEADRQRAERDGARGRQALAPDGPAALAVEHRRRGRGRAWPPPRHRREASAPGPVGSPRRAALRTEMPSSMPIRWKGLYMAA